MDIFSGALMVFVGMMAGGILTSTMMRWFALVWETLRSPTTQPRRMAVLVSLFHAGPWLLVVVAIFAYYEHSEQWAQLIGVGALLWTIFITFQVRRLRKIVKRRQAQSDR